MNIVFAAIIALSTLMLLIIDPSLVLPALTDSSMKAVELSLKLLAVYAVWSGLLAICEATGLTRRLSRLLRPVIRFLYGGIPEDAAGFLTLNMAANVLGMGNAATPAAMSAVKKLDGGQDTANFAMIMLVVVNSVGLQVLPTSVISLRQTYGSVSASDIILPTLIASAASLAFGVMCVFALYRSFPRGRGRRKASIKGNGLCNSKEAAVTANNAALSRRGKAVARGAPLSKANKAQTAASARLNRGERDSKADSAGGRGNICT